MSIADSPHGLLLRHLEVWAVRKQRSVNVELLDQLLELRSAYDDLEASYWPPGSVEHLLLERWPSKGSVQAPDPAELTDSLDAFFRFLRSTGRMSPRSADPKELTREARRAAPRMPEVSADKATWSPTKVLMDFGRGIGLDLDDVPDVETLEQRLTAITAAWNALPEHERVRRMPHPGDDVGDEVNGRESAMRRYGVDDPLVALLLTFRHELPTGELPPEEVVGPQFANAPFGRAMRELAAWVGEGKQVTGTGVLRPALARQAYEDLGLEAWTRSRVEREYPDESMPGVAAMGLDAWIDREVARPWSRAADCPALHRLWRGAAGCGLITIGTTSARAQDAPDDPASVVARGVRSCVAAMNVVAENPARSAPVVFALMSSYVRGRELVSWDEILQFWQGWHRSEQDQADYGDNPWFQHHDGTWVSSSIGELADTGLFVESVDGVKLTQAGDVFVAAWLRYMQG